MLHCQMPAAALPNNTTRSPVFFVFPCLYVCCSLGFSAPLFLLLSLCFCFYISCKKVAPHTPTHPSPSLNNSWLGVDSWKRRGQGITSKGNKNMHPSKVYETASVLSSAHPIYPSSQTSISVLVKASNTLKQP